LKDERSQRNTKTRSSADVTLVAKDGKEFKAHRQVLSEASPFFEKLLSSEAGKLYLMFKVNFHFWILHSTFRVPTFTGQCRTQSLGLLATAR